MKSIWGFLLIGEILGEAILTGILPLTKSYLYASLAIGSSALYMKALYAFINILALECLMSCKGYIVMRTALKSRYDRTHQVCSTASSHRSIAAVNNIPQRIQEDIKLSYLNRYSAWVEYAISGLILIYLLYVNMSYPILIAAALGYAGISLILAYLFNPKLMHAEKIVQMHEANFREKLTSRLSPVGLVEANHANVVASKIRLGFGLFTKIQVAVLTVAPFVLLAPALIAHTINFQQIMEYSNTFGLIVINAAILITIFPTLIQGRASEDRVQELKR